MLRWTAVCLLAILLCGGANEQATAQTCPGKSGDECAFEQADKELAGVAAAVLVRIDAFAHASTRQEAKDKFAEAQRTWAALRDLDCQAESAFQWLRSARTREGYTASCKQALTAARIMELRRRYLLKN